METILQYLPLLNLLILPIFAAYLKNEIRLHTLELHAVRVALEMGWHDQRHEHHGKGN